ncbi:MAG: polyphosphate polymerase domain-containing protein [Clostridia bacterium]|nr:polyphosphate polymerase domain-containing protein [Clostridia bacterium]
MAQNTFCRREKKLLIDQALMPVLQRELEPYMDADKYNVDGQPYPICNLYFDDDADSIIRHSISKPTFKEKMRLRSYGTPDMDTKVFLEIKRKSCRIGTKRRIKMKLSEAYAYLNHGTPPSDMSPLDTQILREFDYYRAINPVYPKVYISYMRNAYFGKDDPSFRVTFDREILTRREDVALESGRYGTPLLPEGKVLLEIKFTGAVPLWFARLMSSHGLSFGSFSKYGNEYKSSHSRSDKTEHMKGSLSQSDQPL